MSEAVTLPAEPSEPLLPRLRHRWPWSLMRTLVLLWCLTLFGLMIIAANANMFQRLYLSAQTLLFFHRQPLVVLGWGKEVYQFPGQAILDARQSALNQYNNVRLLLDPDTGKAASRQQKFNHYWQKDMPVLVTELGLMTDSVQTLYRQASLDMQRDAPLGTTGDITFYRSRNEVDVYYAVTARNVQQKDKKAPTVLFRCRETRPRALCSGLMRHQQLLVRYQFQRDYLPHWQTYEQNIRTFLDSAWQGIP